MTIRQQNRRAGVSFGLRWPVMDASASQRQLRHHAGCSDAELAQSGRSGPITDLSINLNPYAPSERLLAKLQSTPLTRYAVWTTCSSAVAVQSLTKVFGVPGIRAAYAVGPEALMRRIDEVHPPWTSGSHAQALVESTPELLAEVNQLQTLLRDDREAWTAKLSAAKFHVVPTTTCFALVKVGSATQWRRHLLRTRGIAVRDCTSFGLPDWIRTAVPPRPSQQPILEALNSTRAALEAS